jgi:hypothetical protein
VAGVEDELIAEDGKLPQLVMETSNALVDLGMSPIRDIHQLLKIAQEVLAVVGHILECLREEHASSAGPRD